MHSKYISFSITDDGVTHSVEAPFEDFVTWMEVLYPVIQCVSASYGYDIAKNITLNGKPCELEYLNSKHKVSLEDLLNEMDDENTPEFLVEDWKPVKPKKKGKMKKKEAFYMGKPEDWEDE